MMKQVLIVIHIYMEMNIYDIKWENLGLSDIDLLMVIILKGKKLI